MRIIYALMGFSVFLCACGRGSDVHVVFGGETPLTAKAKDTRVVEFRCPACAKPVAAGASICGDRNNCGISLRWREKYDCGYCGGCGRCRACFLLQQERGSCYNCNGTGSRIYLGETRECPNCKGLKICFICTKGGESAGALGLCDFCGGEKKLSVEELKDKAARAPQPIAPDQSEPAPKDGS